MLFQFQRRNLLAVITQEWRPLGCIWESQRQLLHPGQKGKQGVLWKLPVENGWMVSQDCYHRELMPTDTWGRYGAGAQRANLEHTTRFRSITVLEKNSFYFFFFFFCLLSSDSEIYSRNPTKGSKGRRNGVLCPQGEPGICACSHRRNQDSLLVTGSLHLISTYYV